MVPKGCGNNGWIYELSRKGASPSVFSALSALNGLGYVLNKVKDGVETAEVKMRNFSCFPLNHHRRPKLAPEIYEKDSMQQREPWQEARIAMIEIAYQADQIFSLSFLPEDPLTHQTWYMRKGP